jgi:uncharacterized protein (TIGR03067 family)
VSLPPWPSDQDRAHVCRRLEARVRNSPFLLIALVLAVGAGLLDAAVVPADDLAAKELEALAGSWRPVAAENNGNKSSERELMGRHWIRDAQGMWTMWRDGSAVVEWAVTAIDPTQNPKAIDVQVIAGPHRGTIYLGIYELDGDVLRLCFAVPDKPERPTDFSAAKGTARALAVLERDP